MVVKFKMLSPTAKMPTANHMTDAGLDFYSDVSKTIQSGKTCAISTGVSWEPYFDAREEGMMMNGLFHIYMKMEGCKKLALERDIDIVGGVINPDFREDIKVIVHNNGEDFISINRGERIAQGIVYWIPKLQIVLDKGESSANKI